MVLIMAAVFLLAACSKSIEAQIAEQLDLGQKYLAELNYEEAIVAFKKIIEIDERNLDAYLGLAQVYEAQAENAVQLQNYEEAGTLYEQAVQMYRMILEFHENHEIALEGLRQIEEKLSVLDELQLQNQQVENGGQNSEEVIYEVEPEFIEHGMNAEADGLKINIYDERSATVQINGIQIKDSYITDLDTSEENAGEYSWDVYMIGNERQYCVSTAWWAFEPGLNKMRTIDEMQHSAWIEDGDSFHNIDDVAMAHTSNSITWTFSIPEEYEFDFENIIGYRVEVWDISGDSYSREYVVK